MKIYVKAKAAARENKVEEIDSSHFSVWVKEPPKDGKANAAIAKTLAQFFNVATSNVRQLSGFTSKNKIFDIN
ncbi:DUF167 domain-containing protein [Candidatus Giovannonibacteria bacterium]|nr:DUF167 domain-containing protein [Candidatus Giovannonibacteria bacterium]